MSKQEVHDAQWFRNRFKNKAVAHKVMSAADYQAHIRKTPAPKKGKSIKEYIIRELKDSGLPFVREHKFCPNRKFRFDWAIITTHCKIGLEYEGLMSAKSRHTSIIGFTKDTEKYNLAQSLGWIVLRYTALNYKNMMKDIIEVIKSKCSV